MKIIFTILLSLTGWLSIQAKTIPIPTNSNIPEIVAIANAGDTLILLPGIHVTKNILISKPLTIIGNHNAILNGQDKYEIISIKSSFVTIEGVHFINSGYSSINDLAAIHIYDSGNIIIRNNKFSNNYFGIFLQHGYNVIIKNNVLESEAAESVENGNGIHCWKSDHLMIADNKIKGHRDGIYFEFVTESIIHNNLSQSNLRYGLHFMFSHNDLYTQNIFTGNGAGVAIMYSKNVRMYKNKFEKNWGNAAYGILMKDITDSDAQGNIFKGNTTAIHMEGSSRTIIKRNQFIQNGYAFRIQASCDNNQINENNFSGNTFDIATNGSLVLNNLDKNYWDKYQGYDLNRDGKGDIPYRPMSLFTMLVERNPTAMMMLRSPISSFLENAEKIIPSLTPENLKDNSPSMKPFKL